MHNSKKCYDITKFVIYALYLLRLTRTKEVVMLVTINKRTLINVWYENANEIHNQITTEWTEVFQMSLFGINIYGI